MKKIFLTSFLICIWQLTIHAQVVYVDSNMGDDNNPGTKEAPVFTIQKAADIIKSTENDIYIMRINPGIYVLDHNISTETDKNMTGKYIVIEASILPGSASWMPELMPVIISTAKKGEIPDDYHFVVSFLVNDSNVIFRGIKFPGYFYPNARYFPIARFNKEKSNLWVEQCLFVGDEDVSHIQCGIMAHGNNVRADHCVFYNVRNSVVFWQDAGTGIKTGNGITNSIIYGATQSGVWTAWPDADFIFKNNIVSNCRFAWIKNTTNNTVYSIDSCIIVNNQIYLGNDNLVADEFEIEENNVIKEGTISLKPKEATVHLPLPKDYLHIISGTLGYDMGAGVFNKNVSKVNVKTSTDPKKHVLFQNNPNPFDSSTDIRFNMQKPGFAKLMIYNLSGQKIETLINEYQQTGEHEITWKAEGLTSGAYLCKIEVTDNSKPLKQEKIKLVKE